MTAIANKDALGVGAKATSIAPDGGHSVMAGQRAAELAEMQAWQITTPEGLIAFFSQRMLETNRDLRGLLDQQTKRNDTVKTLNEMQRILNSVKENEKLEPGSAKWEEFDKLLKESRAGLPESSLADEVSARLVQAAQRQTPYADDWADKDTAAKAGAGCIPPVVPEPLMNGKWRVVSANGPAAGLNTNDAKDLATKLKNVADQMQGANQMDSVRVQEAVSRISQIMSTVSNIIAKLDDGKKTAINNMR